MIYSVDSFNSRYWKDIVSSAKNEPRGVKANTMCIAYRSKADTNEVVGMKHKTKGNHSRQGSCLLNVTYYKLRARKYFAYYIIDRVLKATELVVLIESSTKRSCSPGYVASGKPWGRSRRL